MAKWIYLWWADFAHSICVLGLYCKDKIMGSLFFNFTEVFFTLTPHHCLINSYTYADTCAADAK